MTQLRASPSGSLRGVIRVPGDKSISHRALILGALAVGDTHISGLLESEDVLCTAAALRALGAHVERLGGNAWRVSGLGIGGLREPSTVLNLGNSGTGVRLLMGVAAAHPFPTFFTGDVSLVQRPMTRVAHPLSRMGANILARGDGRLPLVVTGTESLIPIVYELPVPSAQVKSAILLAGISAPGETTVIEPQTTRDHTERLLRRFGANVQTEALGSGNRVTVVGEPELVPAAVDVPGDASSAAFAVVAALLTPDSEVRIEGVGMNPHRTGLFETLREMGADLSASNERSAGGEPVADLTARTSALTGITLPTERVPVMIDEFPILAVAAASASGETRMEGLGELRVKESNRLAATALGLDAAGVPASIDGDTLVVQGLGEAPPGGGSIAAPHDHRIAMAFLVLGLTAKAPMIVDGSEAIDTSFPGFADLLAELGANLTEP